MGFIFSNAIAQPQFSGDSGIMRQKRILPELKALLETEIFTILLNNSVLKTKLSNPWWNPPGWNETLLKWDPFTRMLYLGCHCLKHGSTATLRAQNQWSIALRSKFQSDLYAFYCLTSFSLGIEMSKVKCPISKTHIPLRSVPWSWLERQDSAFHGSGNLGVLGLFS